MSVEIKVEGEFLFLRIFFNEIFDCIDYWLNFLIAVFIVISVEILTERVHSIVSSIDSIWVQHRNYFEREKSSQDVSS